MNNEKHVNLPDIEMHEKTFPEPKQIEIDKTDSKIIQNKKQVLEKNHKQDESNVDEHNNQNKDSQNNENHHENLEKFEIPLNLKRTFICSVCLFVVGVTLIIIGFIEQVKAADPGNGITFWLLGSVVFVPGAYYSYQFYKAKKNHDNRRDEILSEIPEL